MFESMIQQAAKRGIDLQEDRMVSNGALMIFAGRRVTPSCKPGLIYLFVMEEPEQRRSA